MYTIKALLSDFCTFLFLSNSEHIFYCSWCHRIFPIQATCSLNEKELQEVVSMLVKKFVAAKQDKLQRPLKVQYSIAF